MRSRFRVLQATLWLSLIALAPLTTVSAQQSGRPQLLAPLQAPESGTRPSPAVRTPRASTPRATTPATSGPRNSGADNSGATSAASINSGQVLGGQLLELTNIGQVSINIKPPADPKGNLTVPVDKSRGIVPAETKMAHSYLFPENGYRGYLAPAAICYRPLYFEESQLERYGSRTKFQPLASGMKFGLNFVSLPYQLAKNPPRHCRFHHHPFETGGVAPHYFEVHEFDRRAALVEAATIAGMILVLP